MSTDALQKYRYAADKAGVNNDQLNTAFQMLNKGLGNGTLVTSLEKIDKGLAAQVSRAPDSASAFSVIANAMKNEGDIAKRTATMMAAFGKSGNALVTMLPTLAEELKNAEKYGNIIPHSALANAELFNDTVSRVKSMVQSFGDTIRGSVLRYVTPVVMMFQDWIAANRELIQSKINAFIQGAVNALFEVYRGIKLLFPAVSAVWKAVTGLLGGLYGWIAANRALIGSAIQNFAEKLSRAVEKLVPWIGKAVGLIVKIGPAILGAYAAFTVFSTVVTVINAVSAALAFMGTAITIATGPLGLIAAALAAIAVGIGLVTLKSKQMASGISSTRDEHLKAARMMVAENQAARIEAGRQGHTGQAAAEAGAAAAVNEAERKYAGSMPILTDRDLLAASAADSRQVNGFRMSAEKAEMERAAQTRYQISSPPARQIQNLTLDEALQIQARKWANEDLFNRNNLRGAELAKYIADNPEEITYEKALKSLREDAARGSVDSADNGMDPELEKYLADIDELLKKLNTGVDDLNKAPQRIPGTLQYQQMGVEDFWSLARAGL
jgi:hypothetical protein